MMVGRILRKVKYIFAIVISMGFMVAGILFATKLSWFPALFFGLCSALFIYMFLNPQKGEVPYDEMFLSADEVDVIEYYDWGFYHYSQKLKFYWDKIHSITAFRRDLITTDEIYLSIEQEFDVLIVSESSPGWERFRHEITNRLKPEDIG